MYSIHSCLLWLALSITCIHQSAARLDYADIQSYNDAAVNQYNGGGGASLDKQLAALGQLLYEMSLTRGGDHLNSPTPTLDPMGDSARMLGYGFPGTSQGYATNAQSYGQQSAYSHIQQDYQQAQPSYQPAQKSYQIQTVKPQVYAKPKPEKVYVPVVIKKRKKKKRKTIAIYKGFYIEGGTQIFGKFKKIQDCKKACEITPNCFAADYNPWLKKCYIHTNFSACEEMRTHPKLVHFKKVPCDLVETPRGLITLGTQIFGGLEQKGIKSLQGCIKKCATAGSGIAPNHIPEEFARQICFGIDYDFATHKCYFHTNELLCPEAILTIPTPVQLVAAPSVVNILLCPVLSIIA